MPLYALSFKYSINVSAVLFTFKGSSKVCMSCVSAYYPTGLTKHSIYLGLKGGVPVSYQGELIAL